MLSKLPPSLRTARVQQSTEYSVQPPPPAQCNASIPVLGCSRDFFATTDPASAAWGLAPFLPSHLPLRFVPQRPSAPASQRPQRPKLAWPGPFPFVLVREQGARPSPFAFSRSTLYLSSCLSPLLNQSPDLRLPILVLLLLVVLLRPPCTHHTDPFCVCTRFLRILFFCLPSSLASFFRAFPVGGPFAFTTLSLH